MALIVFVVWDTFVLSVSGPCSACILDPIALFASLSRRGLGKRIAKVDQGLRRRKFPRPSCLPSPIWEGPAAPGNARNVVDSFPGPLQFCLNSLWSSQTKKETVGSLTRGIHVNNNKKQVTHWNTNPQSGQYRTYAHSHHRGSGSHGQLFRPCYIFRPHQHGIAVGQKISTRSPMHSALYCASSTQHMWELVAGNRTAVLPRHALGRWISLKGPLKYLLMRLLGKNQLAITLHMYASIGPNLDNTHRGQI